MTGTDLALYRSVRKDEFPGGVIVNDKAVEGMLYPSFAPKEIVNRQTGEITKRDPDISPYPDGDEQFVDPGGGTSLFDKPDRFPKKYWWSFAIPKGTVVPESLQIIFTGFNKRYDANHYQIEPAARRMPLEAYKGALDNLARNAVVKLYEKAHAGG
jgi:hypothetical protein